MHTYSLGNLTFTRKAHGFTLLELLVVMGIVGVLVSAVIVYASKARLRARDARRIADMNSVQIALERFYSYSKVYPDPTGTSDNGFCGLGTQPGFVKNLAMLPKDPMDTSAVCNGAIPTFAYEYFTAVSAGPREALLRIRAFENPKTLLNGALGEDLDGAITPHSSGGWIGGSKGIDGVYCAGAGCANLNCGDPVDDTIYCIRLE